jgi:hypothetical protein
MDRPVEVASLYVAMVAEVALQECAAGGDLPALRAALWQVARLT